jgi:hypothetical protein
MKIWLLLFAVVFVCSSLEASSYKFGDYVETDLVIDSEKVDAYRHQMPRFGFHHRLSVAMDQPVTKHVGLQFDDGLFVLPVYPLQTKAGRLIRLDVEITADDTSLQTVVGTPTYAQTATSIPVNSTNPIVVTYIWTTQPNGNETTLSVLYTLTVLACFWVVIVSSGILHGKLDSSSETSITSGAPKWD